MKRDSDVQNTFHANRSVSKLGGSTKFQMKPSSRSSTSTVFRGLNSVLSKLETDMLIQLMIFI